MAHTLIKKIGKDHKNTIQTFLSRIFSFGISLLFKIVLARILTVEENGVYGKWLASCNYGIIAFSLGLNLSMIYYAKSNKSSISNSFTLNLLIYSTLLIICVFIALFTPSIVYSITLCFAVFFDLIISSMNSIQLTNNKITIFNLTEIVRNFLILIICLIPLMFFEVDNLNLLFTSYSLALLLTIFIFSLKLNFSFTNFRNIIFPDKDYIKYGLKGTILNVLGQSLYIVDIFIVGILAGPRYLGLYIVASSIARLLWFFVDAAGTVIFPKLIENSGNDNSKNVIYQLSTFSFIISVTGIIIFYYFGEFLISITFGINYTEAFYTIIILMIASPGMILYKLINRYLAAKNDWNISYISISISLLLNIIVNYLLVEKYNIIGAAIASLISYWFCGFLIAKLAKFHLFKLMFYKSFLK